eukprot:gb/GECG01016232.1/.p1 GENE.gb/GECG01016232.1/~~gb/GECG01016232.1/.p1  ORF type:complete len:224 (+),score=35.97 gb/GECG01016232.1/:1-672(+)
MFRIVSLEVSFHHLVWFCRICDGGNVPYSYIVGYGALGRDGYISKGGKDELLVPLRQGERVEWDFSVKDAKDLEFTIFFVSSENKNLSKALSEGINVATLLDKEATGNPEEKSFVVDNTMQDVKKFNETLKTPGTDKKKPKKGEEQDKTVVLIRAPKRAQQEKGSWTLTSSSGNGAEQGYVVMRWNNTHSWVTAKTVARCIFVVKPNESSVSNDANAAGSSSL